MFRFFLLLLVTLLLIACGGGSGGDGSDELKEVKEVKEVKEEENIGNVQPPLFNLYASASGLQGAINLIADDHISKRSLDITADGQLSFGDVFESATSVVFTLSYDEHIQSCELSEPVATFSDQDYELFITCLPKYFSATVVARNITSPVLVSNDNGVTTHTIEANATVSFDSYVYGREYDFVVTDSGLYQQCEIDNVSGVFAAENIEVILSCFSSGELLISREGVLDSAVNIIINNTLVAVTGSGQLLATLPVGAEYTVTIEDNSPEQDCSLNKTSGTIIQGVNSLIMTCEKLDLTDTGSGNIYYLDSVNGEDSNTGLSEQSPWKTLDRLNNTDLSAGDTIRFKRNSVWAGMLELLSLVGSADEPITLEPYGDGARPMISGLECVSPICGDESAQWSLLQGNIYQIVIDWSPGIVLENGVPLTFVNFESSDPSTALEKMAPGRFVWNHNTNTLYVWTLAGDTPGLSDIKVGKHEYNVRMQGSQHVHMSGLALRGASRHCLLATHTTDLVLDDLSVDYCGGIWDENGPFYLGNGVEIAGASARVIVQNSTFNEIFDSAISPQAYLWTDFEMRDIQILNNTIKHCGLAGIELTNWTKRARQVSITIEGNQIIEMGHGWADPYNTNNSNGVGILALAPDESSEISGLTIRNNDISAGRLDGITLGMDTGWVLIEGNTITGNDGAGVFLWDDNPETTTGAFLTGNTIHNQKGSGIAYKLSGGPGVELEDNAITDNELGGVATDPDEHSLLYRPQ